MALAEPRDRTLLDKNINRNIPTYADASGKLQVMLPIGPISGPAAYEPVLTLNAGKE